MPDEIKALTALSWAAANLDLFTYGEIADFIQLARGPEHESVVALRALDAQDGAKW